MRELTQFKKFPGRDATRTEEELDREAWEAILQGTDYGSAGGGGGAAAAAAATPADEDRTVDAMSRDGQQVEFTDADGLLWRELLEQGSAGSAAGSAGGGGAAPGPPNPVPGQFFRQSTKFKN